MQKTQDVVFYGLCVEFREGRAMVSEIVIAILKNLFCVLRRAWLVQPIRDNNNYTLP